MLSRVSYEWSILGSWQDNMEATGGIPCFLLCLEPETVGRDIPFGQVHHHLRVDAMCEQSVVCQLQTWTLTLDGEISVD